MNTRHHIASFGFALLLFALLAPAVLAQAPSDGAFLPEGIEATGDTAEVRALNAWADKQRMTDPEQARQAVERALALARDLDDQRGLGAGLRILGNLIVSSDPYQAERHYAEALEASEQVGDAHGVAKSRRNMGNAYRDQGELEMALEAYFDALAGFERLGDTRGQASVLNSIGITHQNQGNMEEALTYYERAVTMAETLDDPAQLVAPLTNFGPALAEYGSYEKAEMILRRALAISEEQGSRYYTAAISDNLGALFNKQSRYEQALPHLFTAERLANELGETRGLISVNDELAKAYLGLGQYSRALRYANGSLMLARQVESARDQMFAYETLSRIYKAAGNYEQALVHHEHYVTARDSVLSAEKAEIITEMQTRYETEERQRDIERLEQENQLQALRASRRQTVLLAGILVALLIAGLFYYRYRAKRKAGRLLEELDTAKSRFFANISHEFRTPLTVILGGLQDALAGRFDGSKKKLTEQHQAMLRNSRQLQRLIDEVLDLNRLEAGKLELNTTPGDLVRSLRRIVEADAPLAERNGVDLTFEADIESCPRLYDQEKLEKIVGNLLSNALKFTPKGGSVRMELHCDDPIEIAVSDTGPGIPAEMQEKIFERFAQVEDGSLHGGTGIGLALAKELAELHGGMITLDSTPDEGSTFTVRLPLQKTSLKDSAEANQPAPHSNRRETALDDGVGATGGSPNKKVAPVPPEESAVGGDGHERKQHVGATLVVAQQTKESEGEPDRTTVLIIEDNDDVRAFVRRSLEETYRVLEAADGEAGLQQARAELPDLIVSDVMLPGIDGYEVARRLKAEPATECIPVVMLTARAAEEDQTEGYGSGAEVYITKPFSPETLRAACARLLEERRRLQRRLQESTKQEKTETTQNGEPTLSDRARAAVLENLHDESFGVEELTTALGISRPTLYRRLSEEAGPSPGALIWSVRLEKARTLLADGAGSVSEVAYAVGFKSLAHFTQSFREHYGELPSSVLGTRVEN